MFRTAEERAAVIKLLISCRSLLSSVLGVCVDIFLTMSVMLEL